MMVDVDPITTDFAEKYPDSFARIISRADESDISQVLEKLPPRIKATIVARLPASRISQLLDSGKHASEQWLVDASFDDAVTLLSRIPRERRLAMVNSLGDRKRKQRLLRHQQYPTHSIGALVSDVVLRIRSDSDAANVMKDLRDIEADDPGAIVLVGADGHYFGLLNHWRLLTSDPPIGRISNYVLNVAPIHPETSIPSAMQNEGWLKHDWLPVVDHRQRLLGGVSRARIFRDASAYTTNKQSSPDVLFDLMTELVYLFGTLIDRMLLRGSSR